MRGNWLRISVLMITGWAASGQTETQHALDGSFGLTPKLDLVIHTRIRTQPGHLGFYQIRGGPILEYTVRSGWKLIAGYYYAQQENSAEDFIGGHRGFAGSEGTVLNEKRVRLDLRALAERFELAQGSDFTRYRVRLRISGRRAVAPHAGVENFLDARGWRSTRYSAGVRTGNGSRLSFDLGYFVEPRRAGLGATRHMWMTGVHWNFGTRRRGDPDL